MHVLLVDRSRGLLLGLAVFFVYLAHARAQNGPYPYHASCRIAWKLYHPCQKVLELLLKRIALWTGRESCRNDRTNERCLFQLVSHTASEIVAIHETWQTHHRDVITIRLAIPVNTRQCIGSGYSTAMRWYAYRDKGTNYCNLHNLISASLTSTDYEELTDTSVCTDYSSPTQCDG